MSVSVIVPTRNGARFIAETIESIANQTVAPLEIIVVDDGSTDDSARLALGASRLVRIIDTQDLGPAGARNAGIRAAKGDFLAFLDHDDLWVPDKLAWQLELLANEPESDVCVGKLRSFRGSAGACKPDWLGEPVPGYLTITMLARRAVFETVGLLDASRPFSDSAEWFLRAEDAGIQVRLLDRVTTYHRVHGGNHSLVNGDLSRAEFLALARLRIERARRGLLEHAQSE
jgi:glycosyltransferase involved in cell wall biosynthesis